MGTLPRMAKGLVTAAVAALTVGLLATSSASAQTPTQAPWDGSNPFNCTVQQAGLGTTVPDPGADPFCVEYDKRTNMLSAGQDSFAQFLLNEPARVAAASDKCFYYQRDHWQANLLSGLNIPGVPSLSLFKWDGSYYFDKASGSGGVFIENFAVLDPLLKQLFSVDPRTIPGFPDQLKPYFGQGGGGVQFIGGIPIDPSCQANPAAPRPNPATGFVGSQEGFALRPLQQCARLKGRISSRVGRVYLGDSRKKAISKNGKPTLIKRNILRWCVGYGGEVAVGYTAKGKHRNRTPFILTNSRAFSTHGIHLGFSEKQLRLRLHHEKTFLKRGGITIVSTKSKRYQFLIAFKRHRAQWLAVTSRNMGKRAVLGFLRRIG
jgi:hypothetical protein